MKISLRNMQRTYRLTGRALLLKALRRSLRQSGLRQTWNAEHSLGVVLVSAAHMQQLNEGFLQHAGPTDVLTFDYRAELADDARAPGAEAEVGAEVIVCPEVAAARGPAYGHDVSTETVLYCIHGILHLAGHDDHGEAARRLMKQREQELLAALQVEFGDLDILAPPQRPAAAARGTKATP